MSLPETSFAYADRQTTTAETQRQPQVSVQWEHICGLVEEAAKLHVELMARLNPICRPVPPQAEATAGQPRELLVPLADMMREKVEQLSRLVHAQQDLLARLEL